MTTVYGALEVPGGLEGALDRIVEVLNDWEWDPENEIRFSVNDDRILTNVGHRGVEHPAVLPQKSWIVFRDGTRIRMDKADEALLNRDDWDDEYEEATLSILCERISPLLRKGALKLCVKSHNDTHTWRQSVVVDKDSAEYQGQCFSRYRKFKVLSEKYK